MNHSSSDGATSPPQAVDDAEVRRAIQEGLAAGREMFPDDPGQAATHAWHHVLEQRQHAQLDVNLAAAEHYLYARSMGIDEGALNGIATTVLAMGYDAIKKAAFAVGMEEHLAADDGAISEPTWESTVWGVKGGIDGLTGDEP